MQAERDAEQLENLIGIKQKKTCEVCGKKVINMSSHNVRMHGEGTPGCAVPCGQCDMIVLLSALGKHVLEYHMDTEKSRSISPPPPVSDEELTEDEKLVSRKRSCQSQSTHSKKIYLPPSELSYIRVSPSLNFKFGDKNISSGRDAHPSSSCVVSVETSEIDRKQTSARTELAQRSGQDEGPSASAIKPPADDNDNNNNDVPTEVAKDKKYIEFLIKTKDRGRNGEEVKSMKLKVAPSKKVIVVKKCYVNKLGLDKDKMGELQLMVNGRKLEEEELVDKLDNLTVMADGLWFR